MPHKIRQEHNLNTDLLCRLYPCLLLCLLFAVFYALAQIIAPPLRGGNLSRQLVFPILLPEYNLLLSGLFLLH